MIGSPAECCVCGALLRSCTFPAYCFGCDPRYEALRRALEGRAQRPKAPARESSSPSSEEPPPRA